MPPVAVRRRRCEQEGCKRDAAAGDMGLLGRGRVSVSTLRCRMCANVCECARMCAKRGREDRRVEGRVSVRECACVWHASVCVCAWSCEGASESHSMKERLEAGVRRTWWTWRTERASSVGRSRRHSGGRTDPKIGEVG